MDDFAFFVNQQLINAIQTDHSFYLFFPVLYDTILHLKRRFVKRFIKLFSWFLKNFCVLSRYNFTDLPLYRVKVW